MRLYNVLNKKKTNIRALKAFQWMVFSAVHMLPVFSTARDEVLQIIHLLRYLCARVMEADVANAQVNAENFKVAARRFHDQYHKLGCKYDLPMTPSFHAILHCHEDMEEHGGFLNINCLGFERFVGLAHFRLLKGYLPPCRLHQLFIRANTNNRDIAPQLATVVSRSQATRTWLDMHADQVGND